MKSVCLDFDGVIHSYVSPWTKPEVIPDPPIPGAFAFIRQLLDFGFGVYLLSARMKTAESRDAVYQWFLDQGMDQPTLSRIIFSDTKPGAVLYIDDRGFRFEGEWPTMEFINSFRPWTLPGGKNQDWK